MKRAAIEDRRQDLSTIVRGIHVQGSVIGALMMRELHTRYGRRGLGYVWLILEPMLLAALVVSLKIVRRERHYEAGIDVVPFIILGYTMFVLFRGIFNRAEGALESNMTLLYHRMVTVFDLLVSRALLEAAGAVCAMMVLMGLTILLDMARLPARPFELICGILLLLWFSFSLSMLVCAWTYDNPTLQKFVHPISYILLPLSGAFYMVEWFPMRFHGLVGWWPMAGIFELIRYGWFEPAVFTYTHVKYVVTCCMVLTLLGLLSIRLVRRKVELA